MDLYGQHAELRLLKGLVPQLKSPTMIDVGAERGTLARELLLSGITELHAFEPHPDNATALRTSLGGDPRVTIHEIAVGDSDGSGELHVSTSPRDGAPLSFGHTLLERPDTDEIAWSTAIDVTQRSLGSLIDSGEIPRHIGILKIDTEGVDLAVVRGMSGLEADVVMVEHWTELPHGLGACPWTIHDMIAALRPRGFSHFAFIVHRGEFVTLKWDDGGVETGAMGNLVFLHDSVVAGMLPEFLDCAGCLAERAVWIGQTYMQNANERLAVIEELRQAANERLAVIEELRQAADDRLALIEELQDVANERLRALDAVRAQLKTGYAGQGGRASS
jgi:FkbM family methyltransferase